jgi:RNA polymerase sigma factor (sigma-70 family)
VIRQYSHLRVEPPPGPAPTSTTSEVELLQSGFRFAMALTHHRQDSEDLTQDAWVRLCRRYGRVTSRAALFTTIRHLFIDRCRRARIVTFCELDDIPPALAEPESIMTGTVPDLDGLLKELQPGEREAIYLHYVEGHTAEEIGIITHRPRGTILSLLHRAFKKLRSASTKSDSTP